MPTRGFLLAERQRRSVAKPGVARHEQPWVSGRSSSNPNGVVARVGREENARHNPVRGCDERRRLEATYATTPLGLLCSFDLTPG